VGYGGEGKQVRDILHVHDLFRLVDEQAHHIEKYNGGTFNVGGGAQGALSLCELTELCRHVTGNRIDIERIAETRVADIPWYVTDSSRITKLSGWSPLIRPAQIVTEIHDWIRQNELILNDLLNDNPNS